MLEHYNDVLDVHDMCEILHIGENTAYRLLRSGTIHSIRVGRKVRIPKISLIEYLTGTATGHNASLVPSAEQKDNR